MGDPPIANSPTETTSDTLALATQKADVLMELIQAIVSIVLRK
jgi:hypothetical protein